MTYEEVKAKFLLEYCPKCGEPLAEQCVNCEIDMAIKALEIQMHSCKDCRNADHCTNGRRIYCLEHDCYMSLDNYCRDWSEEE